jgi:hypothetical protein
VRLETPLEPDDKPILPGESVTLKIPENRVRGYEAIRERDKKEDAKKVEFDLQLINFGDGTGLQGKDGHRIPVPTKRSSQDVPLPKEPSGACRPEPALRRPGDSAAILSAAYFTEPARALRVDFSPPGTGRAFVRLQLSEHPRLLAGQNRLFVSLSLRQLL